ncbi:Mitochondrial tRNAs modification protein [Sporothrix curviconia]|uniref:N(6)-L-threonylcarbamoyladenine synthase n=1 Tax=Sporothrix curviconia TaxID=1260050 RepID=A0ABP0BSS7_9PEZI
MRAFTRLPLVTLAIETSCDDTCVAVLEKEVASSSSLSTASRPRARLLFEERITADNRAFGGIHPLTSTESHTAALAPLVQRATASLPPAFAKPDFVSVTRGPGMASSLATGLAVAKGLAVAWQVPLLGVHHMQAHALTPRLVEAMAASEAKEGEDGTHLPQVDFPYLSFLVSGGHTMLVYSRTLTDHRVLATTANIAIGDLLDKCARAILPRGYIAAAEAKAGRSLPYGALLEAFAFESSGSSGGSDYKRDYGYPALRRDEMAPFVGPGWQLEAPLAKNALRKALRFDFSGLNGSVIKLAGGDPPSGEEAGGAVRGIDIRGMMDMLEDERRLLARGTMQQAFEHLASRLLLALKANEEAAAGQSKRRKESKENKENKEIDGKPTCLVVSGGVASNQFLRHVLRSALNVRGYGDLPVVAPPPSLCTDNAAMIAWAGMEMYEAGWQTDLSIRPIRKWSMDADADDGGILGPDGWLKKE